MLDRRIRPLALAYVKNQRGQILLHKFFDSVKNETFYRPLGGGIEFQESGKIAAEREILEEIDKKFKVSGLVATFENIFVYEGKPGHEIVMLFAGNFVDVAAYELQEFDIVESGQVIGKAVWRSFQEISIEGAKLYPDGLEQTIKDLNL